MSTSLFLISVIIFLIGGESLTRSKWQLRGGNTNTNPRNDLNSISSATSSVDSNFNNKGRSPTRLFNAEQDKNNECKSTIPTHTRASFNLTGKTADSCLFSATNDREIFRDKTIVYNGPSAYQVYLKWDEGPKRVLFVSKPDEDISRAVAQSILHLRKRGLEVYVEELTYEYLKKSYGLSDGVDEETESPLAHIFKIVEHKDIIDLVLCFGGDGLVMHTNSFFIKGGLPPFMVFDFGSLGFLAPFKFEEFRESMDAVTAGEAMLTLRMRLQCTIRRRGVACGTYHVLNEAVIDRGPSPFLCNLDIYCDDQFLTTAQADGIIIATPTGSTAYSLSAGGSMVHPSVPAILLTPICPHTLSFRPLLLPDSCVLRCEVPFDTRSHGWVSFDGKFRQELEPGDCLEISMSPYPMPTINRHNFTADWFEALRSAFMFNQRPKQRKLNFNISDDISDDNNSS